MLKKRILFSTKLSTLILSNLGTGTRAETHTVKAATITEEDEKLIALSYELHYRTQDGANLPRNKVIGLD
jgi:uncharacterized protein YcfL